MAKEMSIAKIPNIDSNGYEGMSQSIDLIVQAFLFKPFGCISWKADINGWTYMMTRLRL